MATHRLKTWPEPFAAVETGEKTHEIRADDRGGYAIGDVLVLQEYEPPRRRCPVCLDERDPREPDGDGWAASASVHSHPGAGGGFTPAATSPVDEGRYTGRERRVVVTFVTRGGTFGLPPGLAVLSIRRLTST